MRVYVVAQVRFTDEARYRAYQKAFPAVFAQSGGRLLAADEAPSVLEGDWPFHKMVLMAFETEDAARAFLEGEAYQAISEDRRAGSQTVAVIAQGLGG